jgi:hypothetical protein
MTAERSALPLRIVVERPVPSVALALQRGASGKATLVGPVHSSADALVFDIEVTLDGSNADGGPRLLGPFVQGPRAARFVYLNIGASAGQVGSPWQRRAKVPLGTISWRAIETLTAGERLTAHFNGTARDGTPACATVPILPPGWVPRRSSEPG